jgi:translation initiation factor 2B subunit (eIF-2B alpha/beta/delta family)
MRSVAGDAALLPAVARALCLAQPSMAGFRTAAALAAAEPHPASALDALERRLQRTAAAVARAAVPLLRLRRSDARPLRLVTNSRSALVEAVLRAAASLERTRICCAESLPGGEGTGLAKALSSTGADVEVYADAAIGTAIANADAAVLGADALSGSRIINKVGSAAIAALARAYGATVIVLAGREKILPDVVFQSLALREEESPGAALPFRRRTPMFEAFPLRLADQVVTDGGVLPADQVEVASLWTPALVAGYMSVISASNMLDES